MVAEATEVAVGMVEAMDLLATEATAAVTVALVATDRSVTAAIPQGHPLPGTHSPNRSLTFLAAAGSNHPRNLSFTLDPGTSVTAADSVPSQFITVPQAAPAMDSSPIAIWAADSIATTTSLSSIHSSSAPTPGSAPCLICLVSIHLPVPA